MQYKILEAPTAEQLAGAVNAEILQGWQPQGGAIYSPGWRRVYTVDDYAGAMWAQALVRNAVKHV